MATKPMFSSSGTRCDRVDRSAEAVDGSPEAMRRSVGLAIEIDGERQIGAEPLDAGDILERTLGGEGFRVAG